MFFVRAYQIKRKDDVFLMSQPALTTRRKPLWLRISVILILAAVFPLLITISISEASSLPILINQADQTMETDADTRVQLIDLYLQRRFQDLMTVGTVPSLVQFVDTPFAPNKADLALHAQYALAAGITFDKNYTNWALFDTKGQVLLSYPQNVQPHLSGHYAIPPEELLAVENDKTGRPFASPVYYNPSTRKALMDFYAPIYLTGSPKSSITGFLRATANLDYIWSVVHADRGLNNKGSSFILNQDGVRIADSENSNLFTAVATVSSKIQQQITNENWYGQSSNVPVQASSVLAKIVQSPNSPPDFALTPNGKNQEYQAVGFRLTVIPWTFFVISPRGVVTQTADQQLQITLTVSILVALFAAGSGFWIARRITQPILRSVDQLEENSESLNMLAKDQQLASSEQLWVVDAIKVGLQSLQYYADATYVAAHKLGEIDAELERGWHQQNAKKIQNGLQQLISTATYITKATDYQSNSSKKLNSAIKVTTQVNEQLASGASSAAKAALQLEQVVNDLHSVVGG
jgi:methyl-accepting chemotaxis protein